MAKSKAVAPVDKQATLYTIAQDALAIEQLIFEEGGELSETLEKWLADVETSLAKKADSYEFAMARFEATEEMLKARVKRVMAAAKALQNARERMKDRIKEVMMVTKQEEIRGAEVTFKLVRGQQIRKIDEKLLDAKYKKERQVTERYIDMAALEADIAATKENEQYPAGVSFEQVYQLRKSVTK